MKPILAYNLTMRENLYVGKNGQGEAGLFAGKDFQVTETVLKLRGVITPQPTQFSIEVGEGEHIL
jgi:hypothetical protein